MRMPVRGQIADNGTHGDMYFTSPSPYTSAGVFMQAAASWPDIVARVGTTSTNSGFAVTNSADVELLRIRGDGNVGIGTATPNRSLFSGATRVVTVESRSSGYQGVFELVGKDLPVQGQFATISMLHNDAGTFREMVDVIASTDGARNSGNLSIWTMNAGVSTEKLRVDRQGYVGIGVANPTARLDVNGDVNVSGNINAKYQGVAEWVPASECLDPGTVVILDPLHSNQVMPSTIEYDSTVAGVVSEQSGITLGEPGTGKAKIATTGRVRMKVDATRAPIRIGDLLVTSGGIGLAMKSEPITIEGRSFHQPGTIVGKALEPLKSGRGKILVLLTLQ